MEGMFRIIQSIPSKKAEPFKMWMAQVAAERVNQMIAHEGASVAKEAREAFERRIGHSVVTPERAIDYVQPKDELPFEKKLPETEEEGF